MMPKVLVVATSRKTRGGITSVVKAHEKGTHWKKYHCHWVQTHRDGPSWRKIAYFVTAYSQFFFLVPFCDLVHIHVASYGSLKRKKLFLRLAKFWKKKTIAHFHPHKPEIIFDEEHQKDYIEFFSAVNRVVVLSPQWKRWIKEALIDHRDLEIYHIGNAKDGKSYSVDKIFGVELLDKIQVIYNPSARVKDCPTAQKRMKYILFAGTLCHRKGFETLIKAFGRIARKYPEWSVVLAGNPKENQDEKTMKTLPRELGIESQIIFPGWVSGDEKDKLFKEASIFCLASYREGFPMAVLDAWAYGLPCVVTPAGGLPDIVDDGLNALMFEYGDDVMLSEKLDKLMSDENLRKEISGASIRLAESLFNIDEINRQIGELYRDLLRK